MDERTPRQPGRTLEHGGGLLHYEADRNSAKRDQAVRIFVTDIKQTVRISIEPQWARFYDFGAGRLPPFLANLVNDG